MTPLVILVVALAAIWVASAWMAGQRAKRIEAEYPAVGQIIDVDGVPVHALVQGSGPDVVLIHGASGNLRDFTFSLVDALSDDYRVIAFDRPGMGYTGRTDPTYDNALSSRAETLADHVVLLRAASEQLGVERPIVVGHSFGGAVALRWAVDGGPAALVLLGAVGMEWPGSIDGLYRLNGSALGGAIAVPPIAAFVPDSYIDNAAASVFAPDTMPQGYDTHVGGLLAVRPDALRANARHVNNLKPQVIEQQALYPQLDLPIEWLHGTADTIVPAAIHAIPFGEIVPSANIELLEGVGHMPHHARENDALAAIDRAARRANLSR